MSAEIRVHVAFLYPGNFMPEEGPSIRIDSPVVESVLAISPDSDWFAAEVTEQSFTRYSADGEEDRWLPTPGSKPRTSRIYIGDVLTAEMVKALPGDHQILLSNMRFNDWNRVVRTRRGNFQPFQQHDVVLSESEATR